MSTEDVDVDALLDTLDEKMEEAEADSVPKEAKETVESDIEDIEEKESKSERKKSRRSRSRSRSRSRHRHRSSRSRDRRSSRRDRDRDREREKERDREKERRRSRSRDRHSRRRSRTRSRDRRRRESSRDRRRSRRSRSRSRHRREKSRSRTRSPVAEKKPEVELTPEEREAERLRLQAERDSRTVLISNLHPRVIEDDLFHFFEKYAGRVRDVRLITDRNSRRSKGIGYIEFVKQEDAQRSLALTGKKIRDKPVVIQETQAEKNRLAQQAALAAASQSTLTTAGPSTALSVAGVTIPAALPQPSAPSRIYVGSLNYSLTEADVLSVFEAFGKIKDISLHRDDDGTSKGFGFITYLRAEDAAKALTCMNGVEIAGRPIKVSLQSRDTGGVGQEGSLDDAGLLLGAEGKLALMQKLAGGAAAHVLPTSTLTANLGLAQSSCFVKLENMFDPKEETEAEWWLDLRDEVAEECEKYGNLVHIKVDQEDPNGCIYLQFSREESAKKCHTMMSNRWFAGKLITCEFMTESSYRQCNPTPEEDVKGLWEE